MFQAIVKQFLHQHIYLDQLTLTNFLYVLQHCLKMNEAHLMSYKFLYYFHPQEFIFLITYLLNF